MSAVDTVLMGRGTYDAVLGFGEWPFTTKRVVVFTHRPLDAHRGELACSGPLRPVLRRLWRDDVRGVYLDGGQLIRQGLAEGVVDDLTISWIPVLLGSGRPLFGEGVPESGWLLRSARSFPKGLVQTRYERALPPGGAA